MATATNRWRVTLNRAELGTEPSLMPDHFSIKGNSVQMIRGGWEPVREIRLQNPVSELSPDALSIKRPEEWEAPNAPALEVVKTEPLNTL